MKFVRILALMLAASSPTLVAAQAVAPTETTDPQALAAALALFDGPDLEDQLLASALHMVKASMDTEIEALRARDVEMPETLVEELRAFLYEETRLMVEEMAPTFRQDAAAVYARYFTAEELKELKRLQENPVMRKAEKLAPSLMAELSKIGMRVAAERMPDIERRGQELVEKWIVEKAMMDAGPKT